MRVCLFLNKAAGGGTSVDELTSKISRAGHEVASVLERGDDLRECLGVVDCVAAAGGDGTIAAAARVLAGGQVPLALLPSGTANNIATSLAIEGPLDALIDRWSAGRTVRIDVGVVHAGDRRQYFLESVGCGLVAEVIEEAKRTIGKDDPESHLEEARQLYVDYAGRITPRRYALLVDRETLSGEYLAIEVLNTPRVGPGVKLTSSANAADGVLSVVAVAANQRPALSAYLARLASGSEDDGGFDSWRARDVEVTGVDMIHVDDRILRVDGRVRIGIEAGALAVIA